MNPFSLDKKTIIVTGASSGIGAQCAIDCSRMGATVVLIGRNQERLNSTIAQLEGGNHCALVLDLTDFEQIKPKVKEIIEKVGRINGIVNCAGISNTLPMKIMEFSMMEDFFRSNVIGAMQLTRECCGIHNFAEQGGSIIFLASIMGVVGDSAKSLYSMTKGALISGVRSLAIEYAKRNIRFNCISPGVILTPINAKQSYMVDPEKRKAMEDRHPLGLGATSDISFASIYLLSDAARWVTGQNLVVDGGFTVR